MALTPTGPVAKVITSVGYHYGFAAPGFATGFQRSGYDPDRYLTTNPAGALTITTGAAPAPTSISASVATNRTITLTPSP